MRRKLLGGLLGCLCSWTITNSLVAAPPTVNDPALKLELVASDPDIVTPVGATFDTQGRLVVIESHTHFPPKEYAGPKSDRIRIIEDTNGDGRADRFRTYYEGTQATMSLLCGKDGWTYIATRARIFRVKDTNGDDVADAEEPLVRLETKGNYPHNGLCGLAFDQQGRLLFGLGENLGEPYQLIGSDQKKLSGGGEGGNIYRCQANGSGLTQLATGLWNPFGICVDPVGRIFSVENDPDSSPPCRLIHVVPGGDFGYQFRYGRSGKHPLQAWDGELPGTLPMVAGTGEAPCDVLPYQGKLWVTSWGDYRIERYQLREVGASFRAEREIVVQGDDQFRPVDFAVAPDGSLYFTDWVDKSYPVHGRGRIWRLSWKSAPPTVSWPGLNNAEKNAEVARQAADLELLKQPDPFFHQAAVMGVARSGQPAEIDWKTLSDARQRLGVLEAARLKTVSAEVRERLLRMALKDESPDVRLLAVRWVADERLTDFRSQLEAVLEDAVTSAALFQAALAAIEWLDQGKVSNLPKNPHREVFLVNALTNPKSPPAVIAMALRVLPAGHAGVTPARLIELMKSPDAQVRREAIRAVALLPDTEELRAVRLQALTTTVRDASVDDETRADALIGLNATQADQRALLEEALKQGGPAMKQMAERALRGVNAKSVAGRPAATEVDQWLSRLEQPGDARAGWRLFFGQSGVRCANCHAIEGRGASIGPDLTAIAARMDRRRIVESLLQPSREVAPQFVPWSLELKDGRVVVGVSLGLSEDAKFERFLGVDGKRFEVRQDEIEAKVASKLSIMPQGIEAHLTDADLRDLLSLLKAAAGR